MLETIWQFYLQDIVNKTLEMIQLHTFSYLSVKYHTCYHFFYNRDNSRDGFIKVNKHRYTLSAK